MLTRAKDNVVPVTYLWCRNEGNLGVDDKGDWYGRCIPLFVHRYPFVFAGAGETEQQAVRIDEAHEGEQLFAGEETTSILQRSINLVE